MYTIAQLWTKYEEYKAIVAPEDRSIPAFLAWLESS